MLRLLSVLFSKEMPVAEKQRILDEEFGIAMTREREVADMCNYSDYVLRSGIEKGIIQKLIQQVSRKFLKGKTTEVIAEELEESIEIVEKICAAIKKCGSEMDIEKIYAAM